jgi:hypothetical protein
MAHQEKVYILLLDDQCKMQQAMQKTTLTAQDIRRLKARYKRLASRLGSFESLSQGSVMPQPPSAWMWTRKLKGKTVTRGLSAHQAQLMKLAIANYRELEAIVHEMREITQNLILHAPDPSTSNQPSKRPKSSLS